jgi:NAD(P)-dependent dehydrogenase (short-subunit alcohol dehydrogenase family)
MRDLANKHFLITGGTSGIGRATVLELTRMDANVTFVGRDRARGEALCRETDRAHFVALDLRERAAPERVVASAMRQFGRLDGAANMACGAPTLTALTDLEDEQLERDLLDELRAFTRMLRAIVRSLLAGGGPTSVVNVASVNGLGASPSAAAYSALKAAIIALSKSAALDHGSQALRVNALVPGPVDTPMLRSAMMTLAGGDPGRLAGVEQGYQALIPLRRLGAPEEVAAAVAWLLSDSSSFVTGGTVIVDGGMTSFAR